MAARADIHLGTRGHTPMNIRPLVLIMLMTLLCPSLAEAANAPRTKPTKHATQQHAPKHTAAQATTPGPTPTVVEDTTPTLFPLPVDANAAVSNEMRFVSVGRITFATNKSDLTDAGRYMLDQAAMYLSLHRGASRLLIRGYTDEVGSVRFNDKLSNRRAAAVRDYLVKKGINVEWVRWEGHGERAAVDENWTELGRARNRQAELLAIYPPPATTPD